MMFSRSIHAQYFMFEPAVSHRPECPRYGSDLWEVRRDIDAPRWAEPSQHRTTLRFVCHECGVVRFDQYKGEAAHKTDIDTSEIGYGSRPERVRKNGAGVWLHPGPRSPYRDELGAETYYVTEDNRIPRWPGDVLGVIGWHRTARGAIKWGAGWRLTAGGAVKEPAETEFTSKRAAALWVLQRHQDQLAEAEARRKEAKAARLAQLTEDDLTPARAVLARKEIDPVERRASACSELKHELGIDLSRALDLVDAINQRDQTTT
jgi:hypothetical protein